MTGYISCGIGLSDFFLEKERFRGKFLLDSINNNLKNMSSLGGGNDCSVVPSGQIIRIVAKALK